MAMLWSVKKTEMPFLKALGHARTGDTIVIGRAPAGINDGERFVHMLGVMSLANGRLHLNDMFVCSNDEKETHGTFYPFYDKILICQREVEKGKTVYKFYWVRPSSLAGSSKDTRAPKPAFCLEAEDLRVVPLSSGKGLILIESKPEQRIKLLKRLNVFGTKWNWVTAKEVPVVCEGPHIIYTETPSSVIVGAKVQIAGGQPITRFFRGHGKNRVAVYDHPNTDPPTRILATNTDFFFEIEAHGEKVVVSASTGKPMYPSSSDLYATSNALVRINGTIVEANGVVVTDSFLADWVLAQARGIYYGHNGEIRMLVIKGTP
jgi:hypothetical protein